MYPKEIKYMKKRTYSKKLKDSFFKKLTPPNDEIVPSLAEELNIPKNTLYTWRSKALKNSSNTNK